MRVIFALIALSVLEFKTLPPALSSAPEVAMLALAALDVTGEQVCGAAASAFDANANIYATRTTRSIHIPESIEIVFFIRVSIVFNSRECEGERRLSR